MDDETTQERETTRDGLMLDDDFIGKNIGILSRYGQAYLDRELEPYHLKTGQLHILFLLFKTDGINQESLARSVNVDKAAVTRSIAKLIKEGYVFRERDEDDKCSFRVFLTPRGKEIHPEIFLIARRWEDILLSCLKEEEQELMNRALLTMKNHVSKIMKKSPHHDDI